MFSAHLTNYAEDGLPTEQHAAYYEARAAGGAGLVITEEHSVHPTDWPYEKLIHGFDPEVVPGYRRITDARAPPRHADLRPDQPQRRAGDRGCTHACRCGPRRRSPTRCSGRCRRRSTSPRSPRSSPATPRWRCTAREGGFDGVELQCSHSSIVRGFLSPATNLRTDGYGGSLERRARLLLEILSAVRDALGPKLALGVRLCGDELIDGGTTIGEAVAVARMVEAQGCADYVNTSIGVATATLYMIEASMHVPPGYASFIPSALREAISLPVVGAGRYKDPAQAERALRAGPLRPRRRGAGPDRRPRFRVEGTLGRGRSRSGSACLATRSASAAWASTAGSGASRTREAGREAAPSRARS